MMVWEQTAPGAYFRQCLNKLFENVYSKIPGETTVWATLYQFTKIGGTELVRYRMGGSSMHVNNRTVA